MTAWMLYAAAIGGLVAAAAAAGAWTLRSWGRPARMLWAAGIGLSLLIPFVAPPEAVPAADPAVARVDLLGPVPLAPPSTPSVAGARSTPLRLRIDPVLPALWGTASLLLLTYLAGSCALLGVQRRRWRPARVAGEEVFLSERLGPAVAGALRPAIVLPEWTLKCSEQEQRLIVLHEREHVRVRDPLLLALAWVATALMPWNPALWWQLRRLRLAVEVDCDARVLRAGHDLQAYGGLLLRVGGFGAAPGARAAAAFAAPRSFLARRIRAMTRPTSGPRWTGVGLVLVAAGGTSAGAWALPVPERPAFLQHAREAAPAIVPRSRQAPLTEPGAGDPRPAVTLKDTLPVYGPDDVDPDPEFEVSSEERALFESETARLRARGAAGGARIRAVVEPDGTIQRTIIQADHPEIGEALDRMWRRRRYTPGMRNGVPVRTWVGGGMMVGTRVPPTAARAEAGGVATAEDSAAAYARGYADGSAAANRRESNASGRSPASIDTLSLDGARAVLQRHHPELTVGSPSPITVFFVLDPVGNVQRSLLVPTEQAGGPAARPAEPGGGNLTTHSAGGSAARAHIRSTPALREVDAEAVESVQIWKGSVLPDNVSIAWIILRS